MKRIIIVAVTILMVLAVTGCDAVLEAMYPEFADGAGAANITVYINLDASMIAAYPGIPINVTFLPYREDYQGLFVDWNSVVEEQVPYSDFEWGRAELNFRVTQNALYRVVVWADEGNDGLVFDDSAGTSIDPAVFAVDTDYGDIDIDYRWDMYSTSVDAYLLSSSTVNQDMYNGNDVVGSDPPVVGIGFDYQTVPTDSSDGFWSESYDPDGWITDRKWTIYDPSDSNMQEIWGDTEIEYYFDIYAPTGTWTVELTVWDNDGNEDTDSVNIEVYSGEYSNQAPVINNAGMDRYYINESEGVNFWLDAYDPDGGITRIEWYFGDGLSDITDMSTDGYINFYPNHIYNTQGDYNVSVSVYDEPGASASWSVGDVTVYASGGDPFGSQTNPFTSLSVYGSTVTEYVSSGGEFWYRVDLSSVSSDFSVFMSGLSADIDLEVYGSTDMSFDSGDVVLGGSYNGGSSSEQVDLFSTDVSSYDYLFVRVYSFSGGSWFDLSSY